MLNELLFTLLGLLFAFQVGMLLTLRRCEALLHSFNVDLGNLDTNEAVDAMRAEVADIVADIMGGMRPPTIADHLGGVLAQFAQIKMMKELERSGLAPMTPEIEEGIVD
tara:strand:+ start:3490 stop:3816 length:327 start_codon:yes stop_codon:yes gene_type:complete